MTAVICVFRNFAAYPLGELLVQRMVIVQGQAMVAMGLHHAVMVERQEVRPPATAGAPVRGLGRAAKQRKDHDVPLKRHALGLPGIGHGPTLRQIRVVRAQVRDDFRPRGLAGVNEAHLGSLDALAEIFAQAGLGCQTNATREQQQSWQREAPAKFHNRQFSPSAV